MSNEDSKTKQATHIEDDSSSPTSPALTSTKSQDKEESIADIAASIEQLLTISNILAASTDTHKTTPIPANQENEPQTLDKTLQSIGEIRKNLQTLRKALKAKRRSANPFTKFPEK